MEIGNQTRRPDWSKTDIPNKFSNERNILILREELTNVMCRLKYLEEKLLCIKCGDIITDDCKNNYCTNVPCSFCGFRGPPKEFEKMELKPASDFVSNKTKMVKFTKCCRCKEILSFTS
jgi:hypothetical protein